MADHPSRVAVVSGAAGGIGASCAARLAHDGFDVVIAEIKDAAATRAVIESIGRRCLVVRCDVTDVASVDALRSEVNSSFGRCDVLLNNAGVYSMTPLDSLSFETWRRFFAVNLDSAFLMSKAFGSMMREKGYGRIISIASNSFYANVPGMIAYVATKGGLIGLTRGLASELGGVGVTANVVAPGPILTEQLKHMLTLGDNPSGEEGISGFLNQIISTQAIKRTGMPADVADVVSFLAGEHAGFLTGQTLVVDGGCIRL